MTGPSKFNLVIMKLVNKQNFLFNEIVLENWMCLLDNFISSYRKLIESFQNGSYNMHQRLYFECMCLFVDRNKSG